MRNLIKSIIILIILSHATISESQPVSKLIFHNNFWVNLHQRLQAGKAGVAGGADGADRSGGPGGSDVYAELAKLNPVFDAKLVAINDALGRMSGDAASVTDDTIDPAVRAALNAAAPAYRADVWPSQRAQNDAWIADMRVRVGRHGAALIEALARAYHTDWPSKPILIDVSGDAGAVGAYTTDSGPAGFAGHATISPSGEGSAGDMGLESIFHEASHTIDAAIMRAVSAECAAQNVRTPRNLWHALIFYTTGELVRREVGMVGDAHYMPYAYRFDVYSKGMDKDRAALEQDWQPWLDGSAPFEEALRNLVRDAAR